MSNDPKRLQVLMNQAYDRWQENNDKIKKDLKNKKITEDEAKEKMWGYKDCIVQCSSEEKIAVMIGNFNYQVENGGFSQYYDNRYADFADQLLVVLKKVQGAKIFKVMPRVVALLETAIPYFNELRNESLYGKSADCYCTEDDCYCDDEDDEMDLYNQLRELDGKFYEVNEQFILEAEMLFDDDLNYIGDNLERKEIVKTNKEDLPILKPKVKLTGQDGNVFTVIGLTDKALKKAGLKEQAKEFKDKAFGARNYDEVLRLCMEYADVN